MKSLFIGLLVLTSVAAHAEIQEFMSANGEVSAILTEPKYPGTDLSMTFEYWSDENGICKLHGFEKAVPQSTIFKGEQRNLVIQADGAIKEMKSNARVSEIICLNKIKDAQGLNLVVEIEPKHPNSNMPVSFEYWSQEAGVCRMMGYRSAVPQSTVFMGTQRVISLNENGDVVKLSNSGRVKEIVCIK